MTTLPLVQVDPKALEALIVASRHGLRTIATEATSQVLSVVSQSIMHAEQVIAKSKEQANAQAGSVEAPVPVSDGTN